MGMAKVLAFVNQKGGVGKTTSAVNLAAALQKAGKRVLLCDFDPQANATSGLGVEKSTAAHSTYDIVIEDFPAADAVIHTKYCDVLASNVALSGAGVELVGVEKREYALKTALQPLREQYDYIFIDCPPSLELLTLNALCAADQVLIPVQCEYYALEGAFRSDGHAPRGQKAPEPDDLHLWRFTYHVRWPDEFLRAGCRGGAPPFSRQGLRLRHPAQRTPVRSA